MVEDEQTIAESIATRLRAEGFAVELAVRLRPDVVLLDLHMPGVGGLAALPHVQQVSGLGLMVAVEFTAPDGSPDTATAVKAHAAAAVVVGQHEVAGLGEHEVAGGADLVVVGEGLDGGVAFGEVRPERLHDELDAAVLAVAHEIARLLVVFLRLGPRGLIEQLVPSAHHH